MTSKEEFAQMGRNNIEALSSEEFDKLSREQWIIFPDLLKITDEESIMDTFYKAYNRKRID